MLKKRLSLLLAALLLIPAAGCGKRAGGGDEFSWFIPKTDGYGEYYSNYEESVPIQWLNSQYWDVENGTLGSEGSGEKLTLSFNVPIAGSEKDYLGNMFASGDMADVIDLSYSTDSPQRLVEDGSLMEITDYVEQYLPNYVAYLDANPDIKKFLTVTDEAGKVHYYALYCVKDVPGDNFMGYVYRRDWVVAYADVPSHIWDLDAVLKDPGDPASVDTAKINYTNYYDALAAGDWTGWKENSVTAFTSSEDPSDPDGTYTDNVVFPSGNTTPCISATGSGCSAPLPRRWRRRGWRASPTPTASPCSMRACWAPAICTPPSAAAIPGGTWTPITRRPSAAAARICAPTWTPCTPGTPTAGWTPRSRPAAAMPSIRSTPPASPAAMWGCPRWV